MGAKLQVPFGIAGEGIELAQGRVISLITPCEPPILKMDLLEIALMECGAEPIYPPSIDVMLVLITGMVNLVKVAQGQP